MDRFFQGIYDVSAVTGWGRSVHGVDRCDATTQAITAHVDFAVMKVIVLASPGFLNEDFRTYMVAEATRTSNRVRSMLFSHLYQFEHWQHSSRVPALCAQTLLDNRAKFIVAHCSSGHKSALREVLSDPVVVSQMKDTKAAKEIFMMNKFLRAMRVQPDRAFYGFGVSVVLRGSLLVPCEGVAVGRVCCPQHVKYAVDHAAVDTLLLSDDLFRSKSTASRAQYVALVNAVKAAGGTVVIMSTLHVSGDQLSKLSGVAALLRFPLVLDEEHAGGGASGAGGDDDSDGTDSSSEADFADGEADDDMLFHVGDGEHREHDE